MLCITYKLVLLYREKLLGGCGKEIMDTRKGQSLSAPATAEGVSEGVP